MSIIVEVNRLTKSYGDMTAIDDVSFTLEENKIYGLLGRNGAGKTTIMHILTAQLFGTSGEVKVFSEAPFENRQVLSQICFIKESQKYPKNYRIVDVLEFAASIYPNWDRKFANSIVEEFRLPLKKRVNKLSRGMLSSVGIVVGLASHAPLTIFDEPYLGLDAVARALFYDRLMEDYVEHPRTVILSTHLIDEVSKLLEHILIIDKGKLILDEEADVLRGKAHTVVGMNSAVDAFTAGKEVIHREPLGGMSSVTVLGQLNAQERKFATELGVEIAPVSLQQLIVHLTNGKYTHKEGGVI